MYRKILLIIGFLAALVMVPGFLTTGIVQAEDSAQTPMRFIANMMVTNGPAHATGIERLTITVENWTTDEQRKAMFEALRDNGSEGLLKAMKDFDAGYIQISGSLGWTLRTATMFQTEKGRVYRMTTDRPMHFQENYRGTRSSDYPFGIIEFLLPAEGTGEGSLLAAAQVNFDDQGRLEVKSLPHNTGAQKLTLVRQEEMKKKKKKNKN